MSDPSNSTPSDAPAPEPTSPGTTSSPGTSSSETGLTSSETNSLPPSMVPPETNGHGHGSQKGIALALGALGVVYGDIGTSPLYALRECFHPDHGIAVNEANVLGILSLFFWSLTIIIVFKYISLVTRADNHGEGGILALLSLVLQRSQRGVIPLTIAGLFGAALLTSEGMLTPAISVTSAVEGIEQIDGIGHRLDRWVVPIAIVIIVLLFLAQKRGTERVGRIFGPIMLLWFFAIGAAGVTSLVHHPDILRALSPHYAVLFFLEHGTIGFLVLGSVVLCITGGEALYADMGHFGRKPIVLAWMCVAFPALLLNYFGQGALLLEDASAVEAPFFGLVSGGWRIALVVLATAATVIASQALISGAFSITRQAIQLGYLPRLEIRHTSHETEGQIYVPEVNAILMVACVILVLAFQSSSRMAAAYGISVTGTMAITTSLFFVYVKPTWGVGRALAVCLPLLLIDLSFFSANLVKVEHGGWVPIVVALSMLAMLTSWKAGRARVARTLALRSIPLTELIRKIETEAPHRPQGTAVFMSSSTAATPPVLLHHYARTHVLPEQVVLLSIETAGEPVVPRSRRLELESLGRGVFRLRARYGFMQSPRVTDILRQARDLGLQTSESEVTFYLGREKLVTTKSSGLAMWRKVLFSFLSRNARPASDFFGLPREQVLEIGIQLEI